jgi:hypothetical protein
VPTITTLAPSTVQRGGPSFTLAITGTGFINGASVVQWNGSPRQTTFVSSTRLNATILSTDRLVLGDFPVTIVTSAPGGGTSAPQNVTVGPTSVSLTPATAGPLTLPATQNLMVTLGVTQPAPTNVALTFAPGSIALVPANVTVAAGSLSASFTITGQMTGTVVVTATLPATLGSSSDSSSVTFRDAPITGLSAVNNSPVLIGQTVNMTATVTAGTNISYSWNFGDGTPDTPFSPANSITHFYPTNTGGTYNAVVTARNSAGPPSADLTTVTINHPTPTLTAMSPMTLTQDVTVTVRLTGTNFYPGATVELDRQGGGDPDRIYNAIYISSTELDVIIPGPHIATADDYNITVINPQPPAAEAPRRSNFINFDVQ